jgi:hypothetical protein
MNEWNNLIILDFILVWQRVDIVINLYAGLTSVVILFAGLICIIWLDWQGSVAWEFQQF